MSAITNDTDDQKPDSTEEATTDTESSKTVDPIDEGIDSKDDVAEVIETVDVEVIEVEVVEDASQDTQDNQPATPDAQQTATPNAQQAAYNYQQDAPNYQQPNSGQPYTYVPPQPSPKDHIVAGLLAIFLGAFGIHKFYLGYSTEGLIMLLVSLIGGCITLGIATGVMGIIGLIEGIVYLVKSQPEFDQMYVYNKKAWF